MGEWGGKEEGRERPMRPRFRGSAGRLTEEKCVRFAVTRLYLFERCLARSYTIAPLQQSRLGESSPDALQPASVLGVAADRLAADAGVFQHQRVVGHARGGSVGR